jgi:hypothetical protein
MQIKEARPALVVASPPQLHAPAVVLHRRDDCAGVSPSIAAQLDDLAGRIGRLSPDWQQPERFFETRSQLQHDARRMARDLGK